MKLSPIQPQFFILMLVATAFGCGTLKKNNSAMAKSASSSESRRELFSYDNNMPALLDSLLQQRPESFGNICQNSKAHRLQIIYTRIDRKADGSPRFKHYRYPATVPDYFYPASVVKLPVSVLALEAVNKLSTKGITRNTPLKHEALEGISEEALIDSTMRNGQPSVAGYIKKIMLVSDNDAFNRLYELLGPAQINTRLAKLGYDRTQIIHRLSRSLTETQNRTTNSVRFCDESGKTLLNFPQRYNDQPYPKRSDQIGKAWYRGDSLVNHPMDFSGKNRLPLDELHDMLIRIVFPEAYAVDQRFQLAADDRSFLLRCMSQWPTESRYPNYSADTSFYPAYCKFLLYGAEKEIPDPDIRIFNKVGDAYGQLTDAAYVADFKNGVEFFLSATIYCNADEVLNDDRYDYETVGFPFLKQLGRMVLEYERKRVREFPARLDGMRMDYSE
jgi:hypothetical protein